MNSKNYIVQELKEICPFIAKISKTNVYSVSPSYFNDLCKEILNRIILIKERAYNFPSFAPFSIPEDYFQNLSEVILQKVISYHNQSNEVVEEMDGIAPLLNTISKKQVYSVPPDFFDKVEIPSVNIKKKPSKIVSINNWSKFLRFSAAAVITSFLAIGLYTITGKDFTSSRSKNDAKDAVKTLSKEEIVNYLKKSSSIENTSATSQNTSIKDDEIKSSLRQVSDKEIQQFLKETGESDEI